MRRVNQEDGMALLIAVVLLLMISAIGLTALQSAQDEATGSGRARRKTATLQVALAGLALVEQQLDVGGNGYPDPSLINQPTFMTDQWGGTTAVRTGSSDTTTAQPIKGFGSGNIVPDGFGSNIGNKGAPVGFNVYRADVLATDPTGGMVEVQAQYRIRVNSSSY